MDRKKKHALLLGLILVILGGALLLCYFQGWLPQANAQETTTQRSTILMDTVVDVRVDGRNSQALVEQAFERMAELEALFSRFVPESEVSAINRGAGDWVKVSPLTLELIELGLEMGRLTEGAFDITIGAVLDLWGFGGDIRRVPGEEELAEALATVDYTKVEVDREAGAVRIPQGTVLDLGGIAKGFIVGRAVEILREAGVERALVNAGGDIAVVGRRPDGNPWRVGVQDPDEPTNIRFILPLDDQSVVTSGDYQRFLPLTVCAITISSIPAQAIPPGGCAASPLWVLTPRWGMPFPPRSLSWGGKGAGLWWSACPAWKPLWSVIPRPGFPQVWHRQ